MDLDDLDLNEFRRKEELLRTEIDQIQMRAWDFFNAYAMGDIQRCIRIFHIIKNIAKTKDLPSMQDVFKGKKIGRYKHVIGINEAAKYVAVINDIMKDKSDFRVKASPIK